MSQRVRIWIAAASTGLFLAGISIAGVAVHDQPHHATTPVSRAIVPTTAAPAADGQFRLGDDEPYDGTERDE